MTEIPDIYQIPLKTIHGDLITLGNHYRGKVLLIVNVASQCGLTSQYAELELLYRQYRDQGLVILGFPANNFGNQEPGTDAEIAEFCSINFEITFPLFSKISVKGADQHPLYQMLTDATTEEVTWNFQKYLISKTGEILAVFSPQKSVAEPEQIALIEKAIDESPI